MESEDVTFSVQCTMRRRWVSHFLGMLKLMQSLGNTGSSRCIGFFSDGDGSFRPEFQVFEVTQDGFALEPSSKAFLSCALPVYERNSTPMQKHTIHCDYFFDAG